MNFRPLLLATALVTGLAGATASAVTWVVPRDFAAPVPNLRPATLARKAPDAAVTLRLTAEAAGRADHPRHLADRAAPPAGHPGDADIAPVRLDSDTAEPPAELATH